VKIAKHYAISENLSTSHHQGVPFNCLAEANFLFMRHPRMGSRNSPLVTLCAGL
jgi:hypothetical protein